MKNLRHGSIPINVIYMIINLQSWGNDGKLKILIKKVKVKK